MGSVWFWIGGAISKQERLTQLSDPDIDLASSHATTSEASRQRDVDNALHSWTRFRQRDSKIRKFSNEHLRIPLRPCSCNLWICCASNTTKRCAARACKYFARVLRTKYLGVREEDGSFESKRSRMQDVATNREGWTRMLKGLKHIDIGRFKSRHKQRCVP